MSKLDWPSAGLMKLTALFVAMLVCPITVPVCCGEDSIASPFVHPGPLDTFQSHSTFEEMRKKVTIKCDLSAGYKDQACVEACHAGAAVRIQPTRFFGSTEEILRRRV